MTIPKTRSYFITLEGIEGAGKSTAMAYIQELLIHAGISYLATREPGGTEVAEKIRQVLLMHHQESIAPDTELLLMFASRAQHLSALIIPALERGQWVLCDRFTDSTYAYQGGGRGIDRQRIAQIEHWVQGKLRPDCVLLFDVPVAVGLARIKERSAEDRIEKEKEQFFERVRQAYLHCAQSDPQRYKIIDASQPLSQVQAQIALALNQLLPATAGLP
jgi:dTMP kinase